MADDKTSAVPPMPPKGEIIPANSLYLQQLSLYRNTLAFGGTRNPSDIWAAMTYNQPETMSYFRELEDKDEDVGNALDGLKLSVSERNISVLPANDKDAQAIDVAGFIEQQRKHVNFDDVLDCILDAPGYGFSVQEMTFDTSMGQAELQKIEDCPQELFLFGNRFYPQVGPMQLLDNPWASTGTLVPEQKFIIFSYRKRSRNRMGRPLLKNVFWPSWIKRNAQRLWMKFAEKGPGTSVVDYNDSDNASERQQAMEIAQAIIDSVAVAVPKGFNIHEELLKVARAQDPAVYEKLFNTMQLSIVRRIQGETLTSFGSEDGRGSQAQGKTHADTFDTRSVSLAKAVMSVVNDQLVRPLVLWNYGPQAPMPRWNIEIKQGEDLTERLGIDSGLQKMGKKLTVGYVADRYDVPLAEGEDPDDVLVPSAGAVPAALPLDPEEEDGDEDADDGDPSFSERVLPPEMRREMRDYDKLFGQLRGDARKIYRERIRQVAATAVPPREA
jgi:phage gp29-like protein